MPTCGNEKPSSLAISNLISLNSTPKNANKNLEQSARLLSPNGDADNRPRLKPGVDYINAGQDEESEVYGYQRSIVKTLGTWVGILVTCGFLRLIFHWNPKWMLLCTHQRCSLAKATKVLIVQHYKKYRRSYVKDIKYLSSDNVSYDERYSALRHGVSMKGKAPNGTTLHSKDAFSMTETPRANFLVVPSVSGDLKQSRDIRWFNCKKISYLWDSEAEMFYAIRGLQHGHTLDELLSMKGLSWEHQRQRRVIYGENMIAVKVQSIFRLLFLEALNPFYVFQVFSVCLWYSDDYIYYATVIVITSVLSIISEVYQMRKNQQSLRSTIQSSDIVQVLRDTGVVEPIPSEHLVPGDVIVVPPQGCMMQCDAVLQQGNAIVNESMLTGESVPVTKIPLPIKHGVIFSEKEHSRHILFCGTQVIQTRYYGNEKVTAVVIRTGFLTSKGSLVRSIMYPPPVDFKFVQDTYKFILFLVGIASFGFVYSVVNKIQRGLTVRAIAVDSLDLITIVVPPALPMAMTVGILYALQRLKTYNIFCISPRSINISGVLNCICFDKTGTLTEDGLDMKGVIPLENDGSLGSLVQTTDLNSGNFVYGMATCHSMTVINKNLVGDPLDLKMFESTGWLLEEPGNDDTNKYDMMMPTVVRPPNTSQFEPVEIGILRQFPFSSSLQRMSVITRSLSGSNFNLYSKGSPEMIVSLSQSSSVPSNFTNVLLRYTNEGYRVLALAYKPLNLSYAKVQRVNREDAETDLIFLGLLVLENRLKKETTPIIAQLNRANIRTVMVTGDNMLTALSVGRECGLVDSNLDVISVRTVNVSNTSHKVVYEHTAKPTGNNMESHIDMNGSQYCFAIEGKAWAVIYEQFPEILDKLAVRGCVFARMSPEQKQQLIAELQRLGYHVGMCGDGANDCGALKQAHAGISLSEAEASVASPFTSKDANISCVPSLIREGRAALVTSFGVFKYMASYSLTQFISVMILYSIDSNLTDIQFLYIDLFLITLCAFFFGRTKSYTGDLNRRPPSSSLISMAPLLSIVLHMVHIISFQTFGFFYVQQQDWFVPFNSTNYETVLGGHENYVVFSLSQFQYIILAVVFSKGPPYRSPLYTNYVLLICILTVTAISIYLTLSPNEWFLNVFELIMPPSMFFRYQILILAAINSLLALFVEMVIIDRLVAKKQKSKIFHYMKIEKQLKDDTQWKKMVKGSSEVEYHSSL